MRACIPAVLGALLASAWLSGCVSTIGGSATPGPDLKSPSADSTTEQVRSDALPTLLLSAAEINTVMNTTDLTVFRNYDQPTVGDADHPSSKPKCVGAVLPDAAETYKGSGFLKTTGQVLTSPGDDSVRHFVVQAAAVYPNQDKARAFVESSQRQWSDCAGQPLTYTYPDPDRTVEDWTIGTPTGSDDIVSMVNFQEGADGWACARSMTSRSNVVVDVEACGRDASVDRSAALATKIRDKVRA